MILPAVPTTSNRTAIVTLAVVVALLLTAIGCYLWGSHKGYAEAQAKGEAKFAARESQYASASANATEEARQLSEALARRGNELSAKLITTRRELDTARADTNRRMHDVALSVPAACYFGPEWVRWWNDAARLRARALPQAAAPGGDPGQPGQAGPADAGLRPDEPVSREDLAASFRDIADYLLRLEAQRDALKSYVLEVSR